MMTFIMASNNMASILFRKFITFQSAPKFHSVSPLDKHLLHIKTLTLTLMVATAIIIYHKNLTDDQISSFMIT